MHGKTHAGWSYRLSPRLVLRTRLPERLETGERVLLVQSGEAFPPGHPSTRLCLDLLREALAARPVQRLLDVGCGAGVLSLAAAALGVPRVVAVDLAWGAARATRENARENGLAGSILAVQGSTEGLGVPFDLVAGQPPLGSADGQGGGTGPFGRGRGPADSGGVPR